MYGNISSSECIFSYMWWIIFPTLSLSRYIQHFAELEALNLVCSAAKKEIIFTMKIAIYDGREKAHGWKFEINAAEIKPRIMEIGDISELENLFTVGEDENSQERKQTLGSKHVENLIKFLFMEINIFSCLFIFPCLWLLRAARTPGEKREKVDIQLSRRGRGRNKFSLQHAAALMRNYYWNVKCRWRNICAD